MGDNRLGCMLEAVLFASGDPIDEARLCSILSVEQGELERAAAILSEQYDSGHRGIKLIKLEGKYQLVSRPEYSAWVRRALESGKPPMLSPSAMEVLAIVAYKQPVTRVYIEQIRGTDSSYTVNSLINKGLIENCGRLDVPGRPALYRTSEKFLRSFGISGLDELLSDGDLDIEKILSKPDGGELAE